MKISHGNCIICITEYYSYNNIIYGILKTVQDITHNSAEHKYTP